MLSIFTTFTEPELRNDPWREAIECYENFADEIIIQGKDWPNEFEFKYIGEVFQEGFNKSNNDWVMRMDIDYFLHENSKEKIYKSLKKYNDYPAIAMPQYQFFCADRFHLKTRLCLILNKKKFPNIKLNGGGDKCLASLNNELIDPSKVPNINVPIFQYDSIFRTKKIIAEDRARFARAWFRTFGNYGSRGGPTSELAFDAWFNDISSKFKKHTNKFNVEQHPIYIKNKLKNLKPDQFGYSAFGLNEITKRSVYDYVSNKKEIFLGSYINNLKILLN